METPVNLFAQRRPELEELMSHHLDARSLDEASAIVFDDIIDSWQREARSLLDAQHARARAEGAGRLIAAEEALRMIDQRLTTLREQRDGINQRLHEAEAHLLGNGIDPTTVLAAQQPNSAATRFGTEHLPDVSAPQPGRDGDLSAVDAGPPSNENAALAGTEDSPDENRQSSAGAGDELPDAA